VCPKGMPTESCFFPSRIQLQSIKTDAFNVPQPHTCTFILYIKICELLSPQLMAVPFKYAKYAKTANELRSFALLKLWAGPMAGAW